MTPVMPSASPATELNLPNMIGRVLLAAILAGIAAGLLMGVIQHVRLTPLIQYAETFENQGHDHGAAGAPAESQAQQPSGHEHHHDANAWMPADGFERTFYTTLMTLLTGAGFALVLTAISFITGRPITKETGILWGLAGFIAFSFAPAVGLPPELPGMPAADLTARQIWWVATIACTGAGLWLISLQRATYLAAAVLLLLLPHFIGAPQPPTLEAAVPAGLAAEFATSSLAANLVMWAAIGLFLGYALDRTNRSFAHG